MNKGLYGKYSTTAHPVLLNFPADWFEIGLDEDEVAKSIAKVQSWLDNCYDPNALPPSPSRITLESLMPDLPDDAIAQCSQSQTSTMQKTTYLTQCTKSSLDLVDTRQSKKPEKKSAAPDKEEVRFNMKLRQLRERHNKPLRQQPLRGILKRRASNTSFETPKGNRFDPAALKNYSPEVCPNW